MNCTACPTENTATPKNVDWISNLCGQRKKSGSPLLCLRWAAHVFCPPFYLSPTKQVKTFALCFICCFQIWNWPQFLTPKQPQIFGCQATLALLRDLHRFTKGWINRDISRNKSGLPWEPWTSWVRRLIGFAEHCGESKWAKFGPEIFRNMRASSDHMHGRQPTQVLT